jgi:hypothetical protein
MLDATWSMAVLLVIPTSRDAFDRASHTFGKVRATNIINIAMA